MQYLPNETIVKGMLADMGLKSMDDLFCDIPQKVRINGLNLPPGKTEMEAQRYLADMYGRNVSMTAGPSFLGAGIYQHFIPPVVKEISSRSEFYTCYTPYQPELAQGMVQALFEYQSYIAELTGMDAANTSMYDSATSLGEAALMAVRLTEKTEFVVPQNISWEKMAVLENYVKWRGIKIKKVGFDPKTGKVDLAAMKAAITPNTAGVYVESPNFFGVFEDDVDEIRQMSQGATMVVGVNPLSLGVVKSPGDYGADVVIGECQPLGASPNMGGPLVGIFACKKDHIRKMPGRIIGLTKDNEGRRAFCMTLSTREQHIRREKATSNICSNEALMSVCSLIHMALLGKDGLRKLARLNIYKANKLKEHICQISGFSPMFESKTFNEFVIKSEARPEKINKALLKKGIQGGLPLKKHFKQLGNATLYCTTEVHTEDDHTRLLDVLKGVKA